MKRKFKWANIAVCLVLTLGTLLQGGGRVFAAEPNATGPNMAETKAAEPVRPSFVLRQGDKLLLNGEEFRFVGVNAWNLATGTTKEEPSAYELNDLMKTFNEMGVTVVRFFPCSINGPDTLEPKLGEWNEEEWKQLDYVIKTAAEYRIRLIIPFVDNWSHTSASGKRAFTEWRGLENENEFYTNEAVIGDFKAFVAHLLERVNTYTGVAYKDDPTLLAWETGNELSPPPAWTAEIAAYVKSIDANHLLMDGNYGVSKQRLDDPNIDMVSNHFYGNDNYAARLKSDRDISKGKRPLVIGEFGDTSSNENTNYRTLLREAVANGTTGIMVWAIYGHSDRGGFRQHNDGFQLHYPGDTPQMKESVELLREAAFQIRGMAIPQRTVPEAPYLLSANRLDGNRVLLRWKGSMGADGYTVYRSPAAEGPWEAIATDVKETGYIHNYRDESADTGFVDRQAAADQSYYYAMSASNSSGTSGMSNTLGPVAANQVPTRNLIQNGGFEPDGGRNLLQNAGFEEGSDSWNLGSVFGVTYENAYAGTRSLKLTGGGTWESMVQEVRVTLHTSYKLSFYANLNGQALFKVLDGSWNPIVDNIWTVNTDGNWKRIEVNFESGDSDLIRIYGTDAGGTGYFDNFTLTESRDNWVWGRVFSLTQEDKYSGDYSLKLSGERSWESFTQKVAVAPDTDYLLVFHAKTDSQELLKLFDQDQFLISEYYTQPKGEWTEYKAIFNSGAHSEITVYGTDTGGTGYFDDFALYPLDENRVLPQGEVILNLNSLFLRKGETKTIEAAVLDGSGQPLPDAELQWESSEPEAVDLKANGHEAVITGRRSGWATVRASSGTLQPAEARVSVMQADTLSLIVGKTQLVKGEQTTVEVRASLADGTPVPVDPSAVRFASSDEAVAHVVDGQLIAGNEGQAAIVAEAQIDGLTVQSKAITVQVYPGAIPVALAAEQTRLDLLPGEALNARVRVVDQDGQTLDNLPLHWTSGNSNIAAIDVSGKITAMHPGFTTITARYGELAPIEIDVRVVLPVVKRTLTDDADLKEVADLPAIRIPEEGQLKRQTDHPLEFDPAAKLWFTWDDDNLYVAAQVHDDIYSPVKEYYWLGDCIQLAVSSAASESSGQWYTFGFYPGANGPVGQSDAVIPGYGGSTGVLQDARIHIERDEANENTQYKIAIPWKNLKPIKEENGRFGLSALISSNNGVERESMLEWGKGIDGTRDAYYFVPAQLIGESVPVWPAGSELTAVNDQISLELSWPAASDEAGVTAYRIYRDGQLIAEVPGSVNRYQAGQLTVKQSYTFQVEAVNYLGTASAERLEKTASITEPDPEEPGNPEELGNPEGPMNPGDPVSPENPGDLGNPVNSGTPSHPGPSQAVEIVKDTIWVKSTVEGKTAVARVNGDDWSKALKNALADAKGIKRVTVVMEPMAGASEYRLDLPIEAFASETASKQAIRVITDLAEVELPDNLFPASESKGAASAGISISKADRTSLNPDVAEAIGDRPVLEFAARIDGKKVEWNNPDAQAAIRIAYTPTKEEEADPEHIVVWSIDEDGKAAAVPSGQYDAKSGKATFFASRFGRYAVTFANKTFRDLIRYPWAQRQIEVLTSKGVMDAEEPSFRPEADITRGEFIAALVRVLKLTAKVEENFRDVKAGDPYYEEIGIARKLGITNGAGGNRFAPDQTITRQEVMTLTDKALRLSGKLAEEGAISELNRFRDVREIAPYARQSIANLVKAGIVRGTGKGILPTANTDRASAAVLIYNLLTRGNES